MFLSATTGKICRFVGRRTGKVRGTAVIPADLDCGCRHCKGAARDLLAPAGDCRTAGGCRSGSAAERRLEPSTKAVVSRERTCRWRSLGVSRVNRLVRASLFCGIVRTVVRCFLRDRDVMGVAFLDAGCRDLDKPRFLAQLVNRGCPTITHPSS